MKKTFNIFISYTVRDGLISKGFLKELQAILIDDCNVYIDLLDNDSIDKQKRVENELKMADFIIILKTININQSKWVKREIFLANKYKIPIVEFDYKELINNFQPIKMFIKHLTDSANLKDVTFKEKCSSLTGLLSEMPNISST